MQGISDANFRRVASTAAQDGKACAVQLAGHVWLLQEPNNVSNHRRSHCLCPTLLLTTCWSGVGSDLTAALLQAVPEASIFEAIKNPLAAAHACSTKQPPIQAECCNSCWQHMGQLLQIARPCPASCNLLRGCCMSGHLPSKSSSAPSISPCRNTNVCTVLHCVGLCHSWLTQPCRSRLLASPGTQTRAAAAPSCPAAPPAPPSTQSRCRG